MNRTSFGALALFGGLAACGLAAPANAATLQAEYFGTGSGVNVNWILDGNASSSFAGQMQARLNSGPGYTVLGPQFNTFCIDLEHFVSAGDKYLVTPTPTGTGLNNGAGIAYLFNTYRNSVSGNNDLAAGLQAALWELTYDNDYDLTTNRFRLTTGGNVLANAQNFLSLAQTNSGSAFWLDASLGGTVTNHRQNLLAPANAVVPEPGLAALLVAAPTAALVLRRRRR